MAALLGRVCLHGLGGCGPLQERRGPAAGCIAERQLASLTRCRLRSSHCSFAARQRQSKTCAKAAEAQQAETDTEVQVEGIDRNYCDEFECTSSPAVERNLRALARDITRVSKWTLGFFARQVQYQVLDCLPAACKHLGVFEKSA